jgi:nitroreductase
MSLRKKINNILGENNYQKLRNFRSYRINLPILIKNYFVDFKLYTKHSNLFNKDSFEKIEADIILKYHSLEKGFLFAKIKNKFGVNNVVVLNRLLNNELVISNKNLSQIKAAYKVMCKYYELHVQRNVDISDYYTLKQYQFYKQIIVDGLDCVKEHESVLYFKEADENFYSFSNSRSSVRNFKEERVPIEKIKDVLSLAKNAPSVCNRQPVKVYYVTNKEKIDQICEIQGGLTGYSNSLNQLMVVVSDRNYFYTVGERNQFYIDGGIFLMNLLYALHFYKIGACPAHWGLKIDADKKIKNILNMKESEKVISLVAIGIPENEFKTCASTRRSTEEILIIN